MPGVLRKSVDVAGSIIEVGSPNVFVNNKPVVRIGDAIRAHGNSPHTKAVLATGSSNVFANKIPVSRKGDIASCGHTATPGSSNVLANS